MASATHRFLDWIFGEAVDGKHLLCIWSLPSKASHFFDSTGEAADHAVKLAPKEDVYYGVGLLDRRPRKGRGKIQNISGIGAVYADIDVAGTGHMRTDLPPDFDSAREMLSKVGPRLSVLIDSGHGLHPYWVFPEPWLFDNPDERQEGARFVWHWWATIGAVARTHGWRLDATHDLTRVLRVPGTINHKDPKDLCDVSIIEPRRGSPHRYSTLDLEPYLIAEEYAPDAPDQPYDPVEAIVLNPKASPAAEKIEGLCSIDRKFRQTWERQRTDLADSSASSYDLAICNILVMAGWADQEIANAIIAWRRKHAQRPEKALRRSYMQKTIGKARSSQAADDALNEIALQGPPTPIPAAAKLPASKKSKKAKQNMAQEEDEVIVGKEGADKLSPAQFTESIGRLSKGIGLSLLRFIKHGEDHATYTLVLSSGRQVVIGPIGIVRAGDKFADRIADATGKVMRRISRDRWDGVSKLLLAIAEVVPNIEATLVEQTKDRVHRYLNQQGAKVFPEDQWRAALINNDPFFREGLLHIHAPSVGAFIRMQEAQRMKDPELHEGLRQLGFSSVQVSGITRAGSPPTTRYYWAGLPQLVGMFTVEGQESAKESAGDEIPI